MRPTLKTLTYSHYRRLRVDSTLMPGATGLERATFGVTGRRSLAKTQSKQARMTLGVSGIGKQWSEKCHSGQVAYAANAQVVCERNCGCNQASRKDDAPGIFCFLQPTMRRHHGRDRRAASSPSSRTAASLAARVSAVARNSSATSRSARSRSKGAASSSAMIIRLGTRTSVSPISARRRWRPEAAR
jgi:hypothetical protein